MTLRKPKPPKPIWVCVYHDGETGSCIYRSRDDARTYAPAGLRIIRYIPAPPTKRRKPKGRMK